MKILPHDIKYAARALLRQPGFSVAAVVTLALGIGATTAIFGAADALLLRPPPYPDAGGLVDIAPRTGHSTLTVPGFSYPQYRGLYSASRIGRQIAASTMDQVDIEAGGFNDLQNAAFVSGNYFHVLGLRPALGRFFAADENTPGVPESVVILSYEIWQRRFGGDSSVLGHTVSLNWHPVVIIGVAPQAFRGLSATQDVQLWLPLAVEPVLHPGSTALDATAFPLQLVGRLEAKTTPEKVQRSLSATARQIEALHPSPHRILALTGVTLRPVGRLPLQVRGSVTRFVVLLMSATLLVLIIAAVNVAGMLLVRSAARSREIAIRMAIGARPWRITRQLLAEGILLSLAAAAVGVVIALWLNKLPGALGWRPPVTVAIGLDGRVLLFAVVLSVLTEIGFTLLPALQAARTALVPALKDGGPRVQRSGSRVRSGFVVGQVAASAFLLVAAGLFLRALQNALSIAPGFDTQQVIVAPIDLTHTAYDEPRGREVYRQVLERTRALPFVESATLASGVPLGPGGILLHVEVQGFRSPPGTGGEFIAGDAVDPAYFQTLQIPVLRGRSFSGADREGAPKVAIINQALAARYWPGQNPIGKYLIDPFASVRHPDGSIEHRPSSIEIVGVVPTGKYESLSEAPKPYIYLPLAQSYQPEVRLLVRVHGTAAAVAPAIRQQLGAVDSRLPDATVTALDDLIVGQMLPQRAGALLTGLFGVTGLLLAAIGIYGMMAYSVVERTHEIGVRMALGAQPRGLTWHILRRRLTLTVIGVVIGDAAAVALMPLVRRFLYGISPMDPITLVTVATVLMLVGLVATYLPVRRIRRIDPATALRMDC